MMQKIKIKNEILILEDGVLNTPYQKGNDLLSWGIVEKGRVKRNHKDLGRLEDIAKQLGEYTEQELSEHKLETVDTKFSNLEGETILEFQEDEQPTGFWGDQNRRFIIKCKSGNAYIMATDGGNVISGMPGATAHNVSLQKIIRESD